MRKHSGYLLFIVFDDCLYFNLSSLTRSITNTWKEEFAQLGLSPSHGYLLFAMVERPDQQQKDYGDYLDLEASTINRLIDTLISKGLVDKTGSGRGSSVFVTAEGQLLYRKIKKSMSKLKQLMDDELGSSRFKKLVQELAVARQALHS